jgi:hypothetical protein
MYTGFGRVFAALICGGLAMTAALGQSYADGAAGGPPSNSQVRAVAAPAGLDDTLQPLVSHPAAAPRRSTAVVDAANSAPTPSAPLAERLRAWDEGTRRNAQLQLELSRSAPAAIAALAQQVETAWNAGQYNTALATLQWIEASGTSVAFGVAWRTPRPVEGGERDFTDVRIGAPRTGGNLAKLDYDAASGKLFAVVNWTSDGWALNQSSDDGQTWSETYLWFFSVGSVPDVDMAVVGSYVYIGYVYSGNANEARLRRNFVTTGLPDNAYGYQTVFDASPNTVTDVAVESNQDSFQNRIYYAVRQSNNAVRWAWDVSTDGLTFTEDSPAGTSARGGLDMHWNTGYATWIIFLSYIGTDDHVHVLRRNNASTWENIVVGWTFTGGHDRTAVSAWGETVICGYEEAYTNGQGIMYWISYSAGDTWNVGELAVPSAGEGNYQMVDITARGGRGTAAVYTHEVGEPDDVVFKYRRGFAPGPWHTPLYVNDYDVTTGTWTALNWTPPDTTHNNELSYGLIYFSGGLPYFNRFQQLVGDLNCDGVVNFDDINAFVLALSGAAGYEAAYPDCDLKLADCNGDGAVNFDDINAFVAILSGS